MKSSKQPVLFSIFVTLVIFIGFLTTGSVATAQSRATQPQIVRVIELNESGLTAAFGLAYYPATDAFFTLSKSEQSLPTGYANLAVIGRTLGQSQGEISLETPIGEQTVLAFDQQSNKLYLLDPQRSSLLQIEIYSGGSLSMKKNVSRQFGLSE